MSLKKEKSAFWWMQRSIRFRDFILSLLAYLTLIHERICEDELWGIFLSLYIYLARNRTVSNRIQLKSSKCNRRENKVSAGVLMDFQW